MTAKDQSTLLLDRLHTQTGVIVSQQDAEALRRAELTLNRWSTEVCNGTIQRPWADDESIPLSRGRFRLARRTQYGGSWLRVPDRETGALRRVAEVCKRNGLEFYHQGDPRGCSLYVSRAGSGMDDTNYSNFTPCHVR